MLFHSRHRLLAAARAMAAPVALTCLLGASPAAAGDIAVIVHPEVAVDDVTFTELRKIMLGDRQFWSSGQKVTLIVAEHAQQPQAEGIDDDPKGQTNGHIDLISQDHGP